MLHKISRFAHKRSEFAVWVALALLALFGFGLFAHHSEYATAQGSRSAALAQRQIQSYCVTGEDRSSGKDVCDIGHFDSISQEVVHFRAPDPLSATVQGDFDKHCATFTDLPSYISVVSLNTDTMQMEPVNDNSSIYTCETFFTLTDN